MCGSGTTIGIDSEFLRIASAIAKQNALFRARYPRTDPTYCKVERSISGAFWDMPVQLHVFWDAIEKACTWEEHHEFARKLERAVLEASARNPVCRSARLSSSIKAKTAWHLGQYSSKTCALGIMSQGPQPKLTPNS